MINDYSPISITPLIHHTTKSAEYLALMRLATFQTDGRPHSVKVSTIQVTKNLGELTELDRSPTALPILRIDLTGEQLLIKRGNIWSTFHKLLSARLTQSKAEQNVLKKSTNKEDPQYYN